MTTRTIITHTIEWHGVLLVVRHRADYLRPGSSHIEVYVVRPKRATIPITETGYRSHFIDARELTQAGGPVAFVVAWLDAEAKSKEWQKREFERRQGDLFA